MPALTETSASSVLSAIESSLTPYCFDPDFKLLAFLSSKECLSIDECSEIAQIPQRKQRVAELFNALRKNSDSVTALAEYFKKYYTSQHHLLEILLQQKSIYEKCTSEIGETGEKSGSTTQSPTDSATIDDNFTNKVVIVAKILTNVQPRFIDDFSPDALCLAYLVSTGCLNFNDTQDLLTIQNRGKRVSELFNQLRKSSKSVDFLIQYFERNQRSQPHLLKLLQDQQALYSQLTQD